ncbi:MAG: SDR family oxidoreductase [Clostridia bacterium]|nr:SDR family oxidoreductase [Clostridia bacterium]
MGKSVLVTGGAGDIGRDICRVFAEHGYDIAVHYNSSEQAAIKLCEELSELGVKAGAFKADIRSEESVNSMYDEIEKSMGNPDIIINNAGASLIKLFDDTTLNEWNDIIGINLTGAFLVTKRGIKNMIREKSGAVINISSMWGQVGASCEVAYSASKGGMIAMTKALAQEVGLSGISVNCVCPGVIDTKMNAHLSEDDMNALKDEIPMGTIGTGKDVGEACLYLAESKYVTGQIIGVNGGMVI